MAEKLMDEVFQHPARAGVAWMDASNLPDSAALHPGYLTMPDQAMWA
jgi:hypothetical protein